MTSKFNKQNEIELGEADEASNNATEIANQAKSGINDIESKKEPKAKEINGPKGLEPTRYGDWESKGRCYDF